MSDKRIGRFTSSDIFNLVKKDKTGKGFGKPALSYIRDKQFEKKLGRYIDNETNNKYCDWGKFVEKIAFDTLSISYTLCSDQTIVHPTIENWAGTPDFIKNDGTVGDIKCPFTLRSFCQLYEATDKESLIENHKDGEKYYWQLVSNAILTNTNKAELVVYCPLLLEIEKIKEEAEFSGIKWLANASNSELPWVDYNSDYRNRKILKLEIPDEDIEFLTNCVISANEFMNWSE